MGFRDETTSRGESGWSKPEVEGGVMRSLVDDWEPELGGGNRVFALCICIYTPLFCIDKVPYKLILPMEPYAASQVGRSRFQFNFGRGVAGGQLLGVESCCRLPGGRELSLSFRQQPSSLPFSPPIVDFAVREESAVSDRGGAPDAAS